MANNDHVILSCFVAVVVFVVVLGAVSRERQIKHGNVLHQNVTACASFTEEIASKNNLTATYNTLSH